MPPKPELVESPTIGEQLRSIRKNWERSGAETKADQELQGARDIDQQVLDQLLPLSKDNYAPLRTAAGKGLQSYTILSASGRSPECDKYNLWIKLLAKKTMLPLGLHVEYYPPQWGNDADVEPTQCRLDLTWPEPPSASWGLRARRR